MTFTKLIIDSNNLFHKCFNVEKKDLRNTIIKFIKMSDFYKNKYLNLNIGEIIYCFDNPTSKIETRKLIDSTYKDNRVRQSKEFYKALDYLKLILINRENNNRVISVAYAEADDIVKPLLDEIDINRNRILLISEDMDWARGLDKNVYWYSNKIVWDLNLFKEKYKFFPSPSKIIMYKTFRGDVSDKIKPGVLNIREDDILQIISEYNNIYTFLGEYKNLNYLSDTIKIKIKESEDRLRKNYQLVNYIELQKEVLDEYSIITSFNRTKLKTLYTNFDIKLDEVEKDLKKFEKKFIGKQDVTNNKHFGFQTQKIDVK